MRSEVSLAIRLRGRKNYAARNAVSNLLFYDALRFLSDPMRFMPRRITGRR